MVVHCHDVFLTSLDPARGAEMQKTRPCAIITPDELNRSLRTVLVAPFTSTRRAWVSRVDCRFGGRIGQISLDQIRCVDHSRLLKRLGRLDDATIADVRLTLLKMFG